MSNWGMAATAAMNVFNISQQGSIDAKRLGDEVYRARSLDLAAKLRAGMRLDAAQKNMFAAKQDEVTANANIMDAQAKARADAEVAAAFAGVSGGSVDAVSYQIDANAAEAKAAANKQRRQTEEQLINNMYGAAYEHATAQPMPTATKNYQGLFDALGNIWNAGGKEVAAKHWDRWNSGAKTLQSTDTTTSEWYDSGSKWRID